MRPPDEERVPGKGHPEDHNNHHHLNAPRRVCPSTLNTRARLHVARCSACTAALATGGDLCPDGERLAREAARHAERTRPSTTETQVAP